jgi:hypothetical protein
MCILIWIKSGSPLSFTHVGLPRSAYRALTRLQTNLDNLGQSARCLKGAISELSTVDARLFCFSALADRLPPKPHSLKDRLPGIG